MPWSEIHNLTTETIAVAMSGGVDSSTVAAMLRAEGHSVIGLTMQLWNQRRLAGRDGMPESVQGRCCSLDDVYDARRVAQQIGHSVLRGQSRGQLRAGRDSPIYQTSIFLGERRSPAASATIISSSSSCNWWRGRLAPSASLPGTMRASRSMKTGSAGCSSALRITARIKLISCSA